MIRNRCIIGASCMEACPNLKGTGEVGLEPLDIIDAAREAARMPIAICDSPTEFEQHRDIGEGSLPSRFSCNLDPRVQACMRIVPLIAGIIQNSATPSVSTERVG